MALDSIDFLEGSKLGGIDKWVRHISEVTELAEPKVAMVPCWGRVGDHLWGCQAMIAAQLFSSW
jgi:hypothetical protein